MDPGDDLLDQTGGDGGRRPVHVPGRGQFDHVRTHQLTRQGLDDAQGLAYGEATRLVMVHARGEGRVEAVEVEGQIDRPFAQGGDGRDHNQFAFTAWFAGGGSRPGVSIGGTDEWGYKAIDRPYEMHDLHATLLHLLGLDHTRLTYRFGGRDLRLTDVFGDVITDAVA